MNKEKSKKIYRSKLRAKDRDRKRKLKSLKMAVKRRQRRKPTSNIRSQLKEQISPTFNRKAYMPDVEGKRISKNVFKEEKFNTSKWLPPVGSDDK